MLRAVDPPIFTKAYDLLGWLLPAVARFPRPPWAAVWGRAHVLRGGSWNNDTINLRTANRNSNTPDNRNNNIGFRCASELPNGAKAPRLYGERLRPGEASRLVPGRR